MKRKRKRLKKRVKFFIFIFIIFLTIFLYNNKKENIDKEEQISHSNISNESISYSTTTQTKEPLEKLEELSQKDKRIKTIIENKGSYPEILLMMLSKNTDMTDYVYHYNKYKGKVFSIEPPIFVELEVKYTEPGFSGNTATTSGKPATLENGYELTVPMFVNIGDIVRVDTRTGEYMERI